MSRKDAKRAKPFKNFASVGNEVSAVSLRELLFQRFQPCHNITGAFAV
jgi:hypothetical protein